MGEWIDEWLDGRMFKQVEVSGAAQDRGSEELIAALATEDRPQRELSIEFGLERMHGQPATQTDRAIRFEIEGS